MALNTLKFGQPIVVGVLSADPVSPDNGLIYYNSSSNSFRMYENGAWRKLDPQTLAQYNIFIGDASGIAQPIDTNAAGDILASTPSALTIKSGAIVNAQINASASIALSKLAALTASRALVSDVSGVISVATTSLAQINYLSNVSSDVQAQIDAKLSKAGGTMTGAINMGTFAITNLADPTNPQDAATKNYVDGKLQGLGNKFEARAATTAALPTNTYSNGTSGVGATLTGSSNGALPTQDGVTLIVGDRLLVKNEVAAANNGIYTVTALGSAGAVYVLTRATDADSSTGTDPKVAPDIFVFVSEGTANSDTGWVLTTDAPITMGTTGLTFAQFSGAGMITAGSGLTKSGNTLSVNAGNGLAIDGGNNVVVQPNGSTLNVSSSGVKVATGGITDTEVNASAAIARSKIAAGTVAQVVINDPSTGLLSSEANLAISRGGTNAATAQAAIDNIAGLTTQGDILHHDGTHASRLARGANGTVLMAGTLDVSYVDPTLTLAKTDLSNLAATTAINHDLLPGTDNSLALGSGSKRWTKANALAVDAGASDLTLSANSGSNSLAIVSSDVKRGATTSNFLKEAYFHSVALSGSQSGVAISVFTVAFATVDSIEISYRMKDGTSNAVRIGTFRVCTDGSNVSYVDQYTETADVGVTLTAALNGSNLEIRYTSTANAKTMRADVKQFLV